MPTHSMDQHPAPVIIYEHIIRYNLAKCMYQGAVLKLEEGLCLIEVKLDSS